MSTQALIIVSPDLAVSIPASFVEAREQALAVSALIGEPNSPESEAEAVAAATGIKVLISGVEKSRKAVKDPYLEACRRIDAAAAQAVKELQEEEVRLHTGIGNYRQSILERDRERERQRLRELERIEQERLAEERRIREEQAKAEALRQAEQRKLEEARLAEQRKMEQEAAAARGKKAKAEAEERLKRLEAERMAAVAKAELERRERDLVAEKERIAAQERAAQAVEAVGPQETTAKAKGQTVKAEMDFEVVDLWTLARAMPALVEIKVRRAEVLEMIRVHGMKTIPGLRIFEIVKSNVRLSGAQRLIDV